MRDLDGRGHIACYFCLTANHGLETLAYCPDCHFFHPASKSLEGHCWWCRFWGPAASMMLAARWVDEIESYEPAYRVLKAFWRPEGAGTEARDMYVKHNRWSARLSRKALEEATALSPDQLDRALNGLEARGVLTARTCDCEVDYHIGTYDVVGLAEDRNRAFGGKIERVDKYARLVDQLDTPDNRRRLIRFLSAHDSHEGWTAGLDESGLGEAFEVAGLHFRSHDSNCVSALMFVMHEERERLGRDPELAAALRLHFSDDPMVKIDHVLATGRDFNLLPEGLQTMLFAFLRDNFLTEESGWVSEEMPPDGPRLLERFRAENPRVPETVLLLHLLNNPRLGLTHKVPRELRSPFFTQTLEAILEDEGLTLALVAWGLWGDAPGWRRPISPWWLDLVVARVQAGGQKVAGVVELARSFALGRAGGRADEKAGAKADDREALPAPDPRRARELEIFASTENPWTWLAHLLTGRKMKVPEIQERFASLLQTASDRKELAGWLDPFLLRLAREGGGARYLRGQKYDYYLAGFLERTGAHKVHLACLKRHLESETSRRRLGDRYTSLCLELDRPAELREHLEAIGKELDESLAGQAKAEQSCPRVFPIISGFCTLAVIDWLLGERGRVEPWVASAVEFLALRVERCREQKLNLRGYEEVHQALAACLPEAAQRPELIVEVLERYAYTQEQPTESSSWSGKEGWSIFGNLPTDIWRRAIDHVRERGDL